MSRRTQQKDRPFGIREWMGGGWWIALALSLIMIFALRSGTVGAPAQASVRSFDSLERASQHRGPRSIEKIELERDLRASARELAQMRGALDAERDRAALLQESYDGLDDQFTQVTELVRSAGMRKVGSPVELAPAPAEAIIVLNEAPTEGANESQ